MGGQGEKRREKKEEEGREEQGGKRRGGEEGEARGEKEGGTLVCIHLYSDVSTVTSVHG